MKLKKALAKKAKATLFGIIKYCNKLTVKIRLFTTLEN